MARRIIEEAPGPSVCGRDRARRADELPTGRSSFEEKATQGKGWRGANRGDRLAAGGTNRSAGLS